MTIQRLGAVVLAVGLVTPLHSQWYGGDEPVPDTEWRRSIDGFGAMLLITADPDAFFEEWSHPASPDYKPEIKTTDTAHRGDTVVAVIVFQGCRADHDGNCDSTVDFKVFSPDGAVYGEQKGAELWKNRPAPPAQALQLGVATLGFEVEPDDPYGLYQVTAVVRDNNRDVQLTLKQEVTVVEIADP